MVKEFKLPLLYNNRQKIDNVFLLNRKLITCIYKYLFVAILVMLLRIADLKPYITYSKA